LTDTDDETLGYNHHPNDVTFKYKKNYALPIGATSSSGEPYSGRASGSIGVVDWQGYFLNGVPHGRFMWLFGGIQGHQATFKHGEILEDV
jgi:hypothetical protein